MPIAVGLPRIGFPFADLDVTGLCAEKGEAAEGVGAETRSVEDSLEDDDRSMNDVVDDSRSFEGIFEAVRCWLAAYVYAEW